MQAPRKTAVIAAVVIAQVVGAGVYALAGPTNPTVGQGLAPVAGIQATDVSFVLDAEDPLQVAGVTFIADRLPADPQIKIQLSDGGEWFECTASGSFATCDTPGTFAEDVTGVNLVISG